jgi:hypothetical protein
VCATFGAGAAHSAPIIVDIPDITIGPGSSYELIIGGLPQFRFDRDPLATSTPSDYQDTIKPQLLGNGVVSFNIPDGDPSGWPKGDYAQALAAGELIDASRHFDEETISTSGINVLAGIKTTTGPGVQHGAFFDSGLAYIGIRFSLPGSSDHFGWVEAIGDNGAVTLTRYGYESDANVGIRTPSAPAQVPEPGTIALLIAGAAGVLAMRRRERR